MLKAVVSPEEAMLSTTDKNIHLKIYSYPFTLALRAK